MFGPHVDAEGLWLTDFAEARSLELLHLNGNALYAIGDSEFSRFLSLVAAAYPNDPFDLAIHRYRVGARIGDTEHLRALLRIQAKFVVSDFITNYGNNPCSARQIRLENAETVLAHCSRMQVLSRVKFVKQRIIDDVKCAGRRCRRRGSVCCSC